ncbi:MAG: glycosyltransferase [Anaerolineae bacterium]|nr:MAG: glycosyltransferase [Anaerolineae bacterium]
MNIPFVWNWLSIALLVLFLLPAGYWYLLVVGAFLRPKGLPPAMSFPKTHFAILIPAHNEASVIADTVHHLQRLDYPAHLYQIHVVADHCTDGTAVLARAAGAQVHERRSGPRTGKGAALSWLLQRVLSNPEIQAVVIFDADTRVHPDFLQVMDAHMQRGAAVVQGQHIIRNPQDGWFPALTWAMFLVDNIYQNQGRVNLGFSAKHMGDSICFRADVLRHSGWGEGLTEDYQLRQRLLLQNIRIAYEPRAAGYGEAPATWHTAQRQRARWLRGTRDASRQSAHLLLHHGLQKRNPAMLEGGLQAYLPSYSTLTVLALVFFGVQAMTLAFWGVPNPKLVLVWGSLAVALFLYPFWGLWRVRAPLKAYLVILTGPVFIAWRTWLAMRVRWQRTAVPWIRTPHGEHRQ